ncbi:MAG: sn-glycerol-3-phosphate ABC transporter ATP-binding protein UgpC [Gaiellaceae bacterium]
MNRDGISLRGVTKVYGDDVLAVDHVDLEIEKGEFMVFVGPSGCGKTTLLRLIAGLEEVTEGSIMIGGGDVTTMRPQARDIAMVFQNYALYPYMTVEENLGFGLRLRKIAKGERRHRVLEAAQILGLGELLDRKPAALSGGQRQRVAIGRAMVREPAAFLMDEPLSNLDAKLRVSMRASLARLHDQLRVTTVYVTHDQVEAMTLGQRVAVLRDGRVQQIDTPQNLFNAPANLFVAAFIGSPSMNLVEAQIDDGRIRFAGFELAPPADRALSRGRVLVGIRPTDFEHTSTADPALPRIRVRPEIVQELGAETHVIFHVDAPRVTAEDVQAAADTYLEDQTLFADAERAEFTAQIDSRAHVAPGGEVELAVHVDGLHFFDVETGRVAGAGGAAPLPRALHLDPVARDEDVV